MDRIIAVFQDLPEKHFRTLVLIALASLLGLAVKTQVDLMRLEFSREFYHGKMPVEGK